MTKYLDRSFSVHLGSKAYSNNFNDVFGKKDAAEQPEPAKQDESQVIDPAFDAYVTGLVREGQRHPIYKDIEFERLGQDTKYGGPDHDDTHEAHEWGGLITEHLIRGSQPGADYRKQMIRVAALAVAAIEVHDRKGGRGI